jgi:alkanesulfonate monooxygenase
MREKNIEVCLRMCIICRPTKDEAIAAAEALVEDSTTISKVRQFINASDSSFLKHSLAIADKEDWLNRYLWAGLVPSYGPSVMTMIGTPAELATAFLEYKKIGVTQFIIAGWPKLDEMIIFGRDVLPLIRKEEMTGNNSFGSQL